MHPSLPSPPPEYSPPPPGRTGYAAPAQRQTPWWGQLLALVLPTVAFIFGAPVGFFLLVDLFGAVPPPPSGRAQAWVATAYFCAALLCGLGAHAIVTRMPRLFVAWLVVTVGVLIAVVVTY